MDTTVLRADVISIVPRYSIADYDNDITAYFKGRPPALSGVALIDHASAAFLGKPYLGGALGEGPEAKFDNNPLYRTDAFDCVTFVSTVLALAKTDNLADFKTQIIKINYSQGMVGYRYRNHFMNLDWNTHNQQQGLIEDITDRVSDQSGRLVADVAHTYVDKKNWYRKKRVADIKLFLPLSETAQQQRFDELCSQSQCVTSEKSQLPYLPLSALFNTKKQANKDLFDQIPTGVIAEIVRPNWDQVETIGTHLNVSHVGLVLRTEQGLVFRHASADAQKVLDVPLIDYLQSYCDHPTIKGINLQAIL